MKKTLLLSFLACSCMSLQAQITETAADAVKNMGLGWNLGNTLDANSGNVKDVNSNNYWGQHGIDSENFWGQPTTKPELMAMMKNAGFGAIRIPVTWYNHMDKNGKVDTAWMKRVHEIVDYVIDNGLYCIINVHHDNGEDSDTHTMWMHADEANYAENKDRYEYLWTQIAEEFKDYDNQLLFAGYNEMLDNLSSWCFASFAAKKYDESIATSAYNAINSYAQSFVDAVRATGGNNATRNLIVQTYASANGYGNWNNHLTDPLTQMNLPKDEAKDHLIFEVHAYPSIKDRSFTDIKNEVNGMIKLLNDNLVSKGAPVIFGEWGTNNVDAGSGKTDYDLRRDLMFQFCEYFVQQTKENGIGTFYWMGMSDGLSRDIPVFSQPDLAECIAKAYHGESFAGEYPTMGVIASHVCFEGEKTIDWGNGITIAADLFKAIEDDVKVEITFKFKKGDDDIQLFDTGWKVKPSFYIGDKQYKGDYNPRNDLDADATDPHLITLTFDNTTNEELKKSGLIIHGKDITLYKVVLSTVNTSSIDIIEAIGNNTGAIYDLSGRRVNKLGKGIFIQGKQKLYIK